MVEISIADIQMRPFVHAKTYTQNHSHWLAGVAFALLFIAVSANAQVRQLKIVLRDNPNDSVVGLRVVAKDTVRLKRSLYGGFVLPRNLLSNDSFYTVEVATTRFRYVFSVYGFVLNDGEFVLQLPTRKRFLKRRHYPFYVYYDRISGSGYFRYSGKGKDKRGIFTESGG